MGGRDDRGSLFEDMVIDTGIGGIEFSGGGILRNGGRCDEGHWYKNYVGGARRQGEHCIGSDSSAAKSLGSRRGTGRIRHLETRWLWLQLEVAKGNIKLEKVAGEDNPADLLTKYLSRDVILRHSARMSIEACLK